MCMCTRGSLTGQSALIQSNVHERTGYQKFEHMERLYARNGRCKSEYSYTRIQISNNFRCKKWKQLFLEMPSLNTSPEKIHRVEFLKRSMLVALIMTFHCYNVSLFACLFVCLFVHISHMLAVLIYIMK